MTNNSNNVKQLTAFEPRRSLVSKAVNAALPLVLISPLLLNPSMSFAAQVTPNPNEVGNTITINTTDVSNDVTFENSGKIQVNTSGSLTNNAMLKNHVGGTLSLSGSGRHIQGKHNAFSNVGTLENRGNIELSAYQNFLSNQGVINNESGGVIRLFDSDNHYNNNLRINNESSGVLNNKSGATITLESLGANKYLINEGVVNNDGDISTGSFTGFYNSGQFYNNAGASLIVDEAKGDNKVGVLTNIGDASLSKWRNTYKLAQTIQNSGTLTLKKLSLTRPLTNLSGGTLTTQGNGSTSVILADDSSNTGSIYNSGTWDHQSAQSLKNEVAIQNNIDGMINLSGYLNNAGTFTNAGTLTLAAGSDLYGTGVFEQTNGTTILNSQLASDGGITFTGGTLTGDGRIILAENILHIKEQAEVDPGISVGTLSVTGDVSFSGQLTIELDSMEQGSFDEFAVTGDIAFGAASDVIFDFNFMVASEFAIDFVTASSFIDVPNLNYTVQGLSSGYAVFVNNLGTRLQLQVAIDSDGDQIADLIDDDDDNDGVLDINDAFPLDASESADIDGDGTGDNADALPNDATETLDTDGDGIGNNADTDDDGDGVVDEIDSNPLNPKLGGETSIFSDLATETGLSISGNNTRDIKLSDVDGDNDLDIVAVNEGDQFDKIFLNNGLGDFKYSGIVVDSSDELSEGVVLLDIDNDNDQDMIVITFGSTTKLYLNDGAGNFPQTAINIDDNEAISFDLVLGDVDKDNDLDLVIANDFSANQLYLNNGDGSFASPTNIGTETGGTYGVVLGDVNGDKYLDLITGETDDQGAVNRLYLNDGSGGFSATGTAIGNETDYSSGVDLGDVDGDLDLDLIVANEGSTNKLYLNNGAGSFSQTGIDIGNETHTTLDIKFVDIDDDDDLDIVTANNLATNKYYLNDGNGNFSGQGINIGTEVKPTKALSIADVDFDGDLDIVFANSSAANSLYLNTTHDDLDTDGDGIADLFDTDDDNDGYSDLDEAANGISFKDANQIPDDFDHDFISDLNDSDDDNDGYSDVEEAGNTAPVITEQSPIDITIDEDNSPTAFALTLNATDVDVDTLTWSISSAASNGTASVSGDGVSKAIAYTPDANFHGVDSFDVQVSDNSGGFAISTVNVTVQPVNDLPTGELTISGLPGGRDGEDLYEGSILRARDNQIEDVEGIDHIQLIWKRGSTVVSNDEYYIPQQADIGFTLTAEAHFVDLEGNSEVVISNETPLVAMAPYADFDNDGLTNEEETNLGTDHNNPDTDADGVSDSNDVYPLISLANLVDTDDDGIPDNCDADCLALGMVEDIYPMGIIYVNDDSVCDTNNGLCGDSWQNAFPYLQDALAVATPNTQIWLAEGIYYPDDNQEGDTQDDPTKAFVVKQNMQVIGGFSDDGLADELNDADATQYTTVLSGDIDHETQTDIVNEDGVTAHYQNIIGLNSYSLIRDGSYMNHFRLNGITVTGAKGDEDNENVYENSADSAISIGHSGATIENIIALGNTSKHGAVLSIDFNRNCTIKVENLYAAYNSTTYEAIIGSYDSECESTTFKNVVLENNNYLKTFSGSFYIYEALGNIIFDSVSVSTEYTNDGLSPYAIYSSIYAGPGELIVKNSTFHKVGGISHEYNSIHVENSTFFEANTPIYASLNEDKEFTVSLSTFVNNSSTNYSGGVYAYGADLELFGNVFIGNTTAKENGGGNVYIRNNYGVIDYGYNFISAVNTENGGFANESGDNVYDHFNSGTSLVSLDPIENIISQVLTDNGGQTLTLLPVFSGPLVDAMQGPYCDGDTDQRGITRVVNGSCDIGAVELIESDYLDTDGDGILNKTDLDDDNDGYPDLSDDFPLDNTEWLDTDSDGAGNNTDIDDDNDGVGDSSDAFPLDSTESVDTDGDGLGNNADTDDDNDGVVDKDDSAPLDDAVGDNQSPVIADVAPLTIEATGELTVVELLTPEVTDNNLNTPSIVSDLVGELPLGEHVITWTATDYTGNQSTAEQLVSIVDTTAPVFNAFDMLTIDAQGRLTDISAFINVVAFDVVDGELSAELVGDPKVVSGRHEVELSTVDLSGNGVTTMLTVDVFPQASVVGKSNIEAGSSYNIEVTLNGEAPSYPVDVLYNIFLNDEVYDEGWVTILSGTKGWAAIDLAVDLSLTDNVFINLEAANNAVIAEASQTQLVVIENNVAPMLDLVISQNNERVSVIDPDNGVVTLTARVGDVNQGDIHDITWLVMDDAFTDRTLDGDILTFEIEPSTLEEGLYSIEVTAIENNTLEALSVSQSIQFVVEQLSQLSSESDSDSDGIADSEEGYSDTDGDGIVDYLDDDSNTTRLPSSDNTEPLQTTLGLTISLGTITSSQGAIAQNASLTVEQLIDLVDEHAADVIDKNFVITTPLYNFTITGLAEPGDSIAVVIPLEKETTLPAGAVYRKYNTQQGWYTFVEDENNQVSSALADENGNCPTANDSGFTLGLAQGDNCIQLVIEDGGPNDADFTVNGSVEDPGAVMIDKVNTAPVVNIDSHEASFEEGSQITITAQGSDPENDWLSYQWLQLSGPTVVFDDATAAQVNITLPSVDNNELIELQVIVSDGDLTSKSTSKITITNVDDVTPAPLPVVSESESSGGGSVNYFILIIMLMVWGQRRRLA